MVRRLFLVFLLFFLLDQPATAQLSWDENMEKFSVVLSMTLDNNVYRVRAKPPKGVAPR